LRGNTKWYNVAKNKKQTIYVQNTDESLSEIKKMIKISNHHHKSRQDKKADEIKTDVIQFLKRVDEKHKNNVISDIVREGMSLLDHYLLRSMRTKPKKETLSSYFLDQC